METYSLPLSKQPQSPYPTCGTKKTTFLKNDIYKPLNPKQPKRQTPNEEPEVLSATGKP